MCTWGIVDFFRPTINVVRKASISKARQIIGRSPPCVLVIMYLLWSMIYTFGKGPGGVSVPNDDEGRAPMWKKKSILWDLPYWKELEVRSAIDVMHMTKNLCVNLLGFLGVYGKTKDTPEAREDLQRLHEKDGVPPMQ